MRSPSMPIFVGLTILAFSVPASAQTAAEPTDELAAQVRTQGFTCDKAQGATRDTKRSKPDRAVWVLKCSNAVYRVSRAPDMLAKIEVLPSAPAAGKKSGSK
jgi:hypothetical protein